MNWFAVDPVRCAFFLRLGCSEVPLPPQPDVSLIEAAALIKLDPVKQHQPLRFLALQKSEIYYL